MPLNSQNEYDRLPGESAKAYAAFCAYYQMPVNERSIDAAWRAESGQTDSGKRATPSWFKWSKKYHWPHRAAKHDDHLAEIDRQMWEDRRRVLRERDWEQADQIRRIVDDALPEAIQFVRRQVVNFPAQGDQPARQIITLAFDIASLARVLMDASKLQRLATNEPTDNIKVSGAALDAMIEAELKRLAGTIEDAGEESPSA